MRRGWTYGVVIVWVLSLAFVARAPGTHAWPQALAVGGLAGAGLTLLVTLGTPWRRRAIYTAVGAAVTALLSALAVARLQTYRQQDEVAALLQRLNVDSDTAVPSTVDAFIARLTLPQAEVDAFIARESPLGETQTALNEAASRQRERIALRAPAWERPGTCSALREAACRGTTPDICDEVALCDLAAGSTLRDAIAVATPACDAGRDSRACLRVAAWRRDLPALASLCANAQSEVGREACAAVLAALLDEVGPATPPHGVGREAAAELAQRCEKGEAPACGELAVLQSVGYGAVARNDEAAARNGAMACAAGVARGCVAVALSSATPLASAISNVQRACDASDPVGCAVLRGLQAAASALPCPGASDCGAVEATANATEKQVGGLDTTVEGAPGTASKPDPSVDRVAMVRASQALRSLCDAGDVLACRISPTPNACSFGIVGACAVELRDAETDTTVTKPAHVDAKVACGLGFLEGCEALWLRGDGAGAPPVDLTALATACAEGRVGSCVTLSEVELREGSDVERAVRRLEGACQQGRVSACVRAAQELTLAQGRGLPDYLARSATVQAVACRGGKAEACVPAARTMALAHGAAGRDTAISLLSATAAAAPDEAVRLELMTQLLDRGQRADLEEVRKLWASAPGVNAAGRLAWLAARKLKVQPTIGEAGRACVGGEKSACVELAGPNPWEKLRLDHRYLAQYGPRRWPRAASACSRRPVTKNERSYDPALATTWGDDCLAAASHELQAHNYTAAAEILRATCASPWVGATYNEAACDTLKALAWEGLGMARRPWKGSQGDGTTMSSSEKSFLETAYMRGVPGIPFPKHIEDCPTSLDCSSAQPLESNDPDPNWVQKYVCFAATIRCLEQASTPARARACAPLANATSKYVCMFGTAP